MFEIIHHPCVKQITWNVTHSIRYGISKENTVLHFDSIFKLAENDEIYDENWMLHCIR